MNKNKLLATAIALCLSGAAYAAPTVTAKIEINTDVTDLSSNAETTFDQGGHVELGVESKKSVGDRFVKAKGAIRLFTDDGTSTRDVYLQAGDAGWDVKIGRFEAAKLFPMGQDMIVADAGRSLYKAAAARGRVSDTGGQVALTFKASDAVSVELGTVVADVDDSGDQTNAITGLRPVVTFNGDGIKVMAGLESVSYDTSSTSDVSMTGFGLNTSFNVGDAAINLAYTAQDSETNGVTDKETSTYLANATIGTFGIGVVFQNEDNSGVETDMTSLYAAYTMPLMDIEGASIGFGASVASAETAGSADVDETQFRVRLKYAF